MIVTDMLTGRSTESVNGLNSGHWESAMRQVQGKFVKLLILRKPDASSAENGIRGASVMAFMSLVAKWCSSVVV